MLTMQDLNHITLQEAEKYVPFDANYLGLLIRKGWLFGVKRKGRWYTTKEALETYMKVSARVGTAKKKKMRSALAVVGTSVLLFLGLIFSAVVATAFFDAEEANEENSQTLPWIDAGTVVGEEKELSSVLVSQG